MTDTRYDGGLIQAASFFNFAALVCLLLAVYRLQQRAALAVSTRDVSYWQQEAVG